MVTIILTVGTVVWVFYLQKRLLREEREERFANAILRLEDRRGN